MRVQMVIVDKVGVVHAIHYPTTDLWTSCNIVNHATMRKHVTAAQVLVFKLSRCQDERCWKSVKEFELAISYRSLS